MSQLKIFVSSTCYDLKQIRADLFDFINGMGYWPIMSEYDSFPVDPDSDTLENCLGNVLSADLFILILGNRYGYITDAGKSITNTEYLYAKRNGIPVYVFIQKGLVTLLPIWKANPQGDFSGTVDTTRIFSFVDELRTTNKSWCYEFEAAKDIIQTLRVQLGHLFRNALQLRKKVRNSGFPEFYGNLSPNALKIALEKDEAYEESFFFHVLEDELMKHERIKLDLQYKVFTNCEVQISNVNELLPWFGTQLTTISHLVSSISNLLCDAFTYYYGPPGTPSDLKGLYYVAESIARVYKEMILWSIRIKSIRVDEDLVVLRDTLSDYPQLTLQNICEYPAKVLNHIDNSKKGASTSKPSIGRLFEIKIEERLVEIVTSEFQRIKDKISTG